MSDKNVDTQGDGQIDSNWLRSFAKKMSSLKAKAAEITGQLGQEIKTAAEQKSLHPGAFKACMTLMRMEEMKRQTWLQNFDSYRHILKLDQGTDDMFQEKKNETHLGKSKQKGAQSDDNPGTPPPGNGGQQGAAPVH